MDYRTNRNKIKRRLSIANAINVIYTTFLCLAEIPVAVGIKLSHNQMAKLMDGVQNADAESYMGGYQIVGGLFGAGAMAMALVMLYLILAVSIFYLVLFLIDTIIGYRTQFRLKREDYSEILAKKIKKNAVFKCVLALLVMIPVGYFIYSVQSFGMLIVIIPQVVVMALAISILRLLKISQENKDIF